MKICEKTGNNKTYHRRRIQIISKSPHIFQREYLSKFVPFLAFWTFLEVLTLCLLGIFSKLLEMLFIQNSY